MRPSPTPRPLNSRRPPRLRTVSRIALVCLLSTASLFSALAAHAAPPPPPLATVPKVDLQRYMGTWYEIARIDHIFQKGCVDGSATYTMQSDGEIDILNRCRDERNGKSRQVKGHAWSADPKGNARLKVSFFWPIRSDYWIVELGKEYEYAVVGAPDREYLWILSRHKELDGTLYQSIVSRAAAQGFPVQKLVRK